MKLCLDSFGNYVIQHALQIYSEECKRLYDKILEHVVSCLNTHFNIVINYIEHADTEYLKKLASKIRESNCITQFIRMLESKLSADAEGKKILESLVSSNLNTIQEVQSGLLNGNHIEKKKTLKVHITTILKSILLLIINTRVIFQNFHPHNYNLFF